MSLSWEEICEYKEEWKELGLDQFIRMYHQYKDRKDTVFKWGDEIEYLLVSFNDEERTAKLNLGAPDVVPRLKQEELREPSAGQWTYEYGKQMVESCPRGPFAAETADEFGGALIEIEKDMKIRRQVLNKVCKESFGGVAFSLAAFPRLGTPGCTEPASVQECMKSRFFPSSIRMLSPDPRETSRVTFDNIMKRRGSTVHYVPVYRDVNTKSPVNGPRDKYSGFGILLDHVGYGVSCCALQCTIQARDLREARRMHDQLAVMAPIMTALSAASPFYRGYISDVDSRMAVLRPLMDDRNAEERGETNMHSAPQLKGRYGPVDFYISEKGTRYNDQALKIPVKYLKRLEEGGVDPILARHVAHLYARDPLHMAATPTELAGQTPTFLYDSLNLTVGKDVRFKAPCPETDAGWRLEFRPIGVQLTDFEKAAYCVFMVLLSKTILHFDLDLLIPMSRLDENSCVASKRNAVLKEKFYFRTNFKEGLHNASSENGRIEETTSKYSEQTIDEIINGSENNFGLVHYIHRYVSTLNLGQDVLDQILRYLKLIQDRASGRVMTFAKWSRHFVTSHPEYKQDSIITDVIQYDFLRTCDKIGRGELPCPELLGDDCS